MLLVEVREVTVHLLRPLEAAEVVLVALEQQLLPILFHQLTTL